MDNKLNDSNKIKKEKPKTLRVLAITGAFALIAFLGFLYMDIFGNPMEISKARKTSLEYAANTLKLDSDWVPGKTIKDKAGYSTIFTKKGSQDYFVGLMAAPNGTVSEFGYGGYREHAMVRLSKEHAKKIKETLKNFKTDIKGFDLSIRMEDDSLSQTNIKPDMEYKKDLDVNYEISLYGNLETKDTQQIVEKLKNIRDELKEGGYNFNTWNFNSNYSDGVMLLGLSDTLFDDPNLITLLEKNKNNFDAAPKFITDWRTN